MNKTKKNYLAPSVKVVKLDPQQILAGSGNGSSFAAPQDIDEGDENDWGEDLNW